MKKLILSQNDQRRAHWTTVRDAKQAVELLVAQAVRKAKVPPIMSVVSVRLMWFPPTAHRRDVDSLAPTLKAALDALVKEGILPDDSYRYVHEAHLGPIVVSRDDPRIELHIRELEGVGDLQHGGP